MEMSCSSDIAGLDNIDLDACTLSLICCCWRWAMSASVLRCRSSTSSLNSPARRCRCTSSYNTFTRPTRSTVAVPRPSPGGEPGGRTPRWLISCHQQQKAVCHGVKRRLSSQVRLCAYHMCLSHGITQIFKIYSIVY